MYENYESKAKELLEKAEKLSPIESNMTAPHLRQLAIGYALLSISQQINMIDNFGQK